LAFAVTLSTQRGDVRFNVGHPFRASRLCLVVRGVPWQFQMGFPGNAKEPSVWVAYVFRMPLRANQLLSFARTNATIRNAICMRLLYLARANRSGLSIDAETTGEFDALVQLGGLEPPTSCSTDRRSNQLSYNCILGAGPEKGARTGRKLGATPLFGKAGG
jgi:hypothetical protein